MSRAKRNWTRVCSAAWGIKFHSSPETFVSPELLPRSMRLHPTERSALISKKQGSICPMFGVAFLGLSRRWNVRVAELSPHVVLVQAAQMLRFASLHHKRKARLPGLRKAETPVEMLGQAC